MKTETETETETRAKKSWISNNRGLGDEGSWFARWFDGSNLVLPVDDLVLYVDGVFVQQKAPQVIGRWWQDGVGHDAHALQALIDQNTQVHPIQGDGLKQASLLNHIAIGHARIGWTAD